MKRRLRSTKRQRAPHLMPGYDVVGKPQLAEVEIDLAGEAQRDSRRRVGITLMAFAAAFAIVSARLLQLGLAGEMEGPAQVVAQSETSIVRPEIFDRNGELMATNIVTATLFADGRDILDAEEAAEAIVSVLPDLDDAALAEKLASGRPFIPIKRDLSPRQQAAVHNLGIPGLGFQRKSRRVYPNGNVAAHVLGLVDQDNRGIAGMELYIDQNLSVTTADDRTPLEPVFLSIDMRVQHAVRDELMRAMSEFSAIGATGVVLDVKTGEVIASVSLPDFDPNNPGDASKDALFNRATVGVYEMGSTFKAFTVAAALDSGMVHLTDSFDATQPIKVSRFTISDYHAENRWLTVPEIFMHSSNIGTAKMALAIGRDRHRDFLEKLGLTSRLETELPESALPLVPARWTDLSTMTISFGHGLSVTPLQLVSAGAVLVNGGYRVHPSFLRGGHPEGPERVISSQTSTAVKSLMRAVVEQGTGKKADTEGYPVMGKTGTAEKAVNGRYAKRALLTSFLSAFPANDPRYQMVVMLDEPQPTKETFGFATAGWNAAPLTSRVVARIAPILGLRPVERWRVPTQEAQLVSYE